MFNRGGISIPELTSQSQGKATLSLAHSGETGLKPEERVHDFKNTTVHGSSNQSVIHPTNHTIRRNIPPGT